MAEEDLPFAFLSYAKEDSEAIRRVHLRLLGDGIRVWRDEHDLLPGQEWDREIRAAIRRCRLFVVLLSSRSVSKAGYVQREIREALDIVGGLPPDSVFIIPARLEECQVPERLRQWHWIDLWKKGGYAKLSSTLVQRACRVSVNVRSAADSVTFEQPEDRILYEHFRRASRFLYGSATRRNYVVGQGHFLIIRKDLPVPFKRLKGSVADFRKLSKETLEHILPVSRSWKSSAVEVESIRLLPGPSCVLLSGKDPAVRCCINPEYWKLVLLFTHMPKAYLTGRLNPIYFLENGEVRAVVMPMRYEDEEIDEG